MHQSLIIGLQGTSLSDEERGWLQARPPLGVILFARNIDSPEQVRALLDEVRAATGQPTWAAIDEEGGRVNRIPWAPFNNRRPAAEYGHLFKTDPFEAIQQTYDDAYTVALALKELGFTHNCAPVLDVFHAGGDAIIGERAYSDSMPMVTALGGACVKGMQAAGVAAVGKHFPGHGRANADSHVAIPVVDADIDALIIEADPFNILASEGMEHIMTAHVRYPAVDPAVATLSPYWLQQVLRGDFAYTGRIWSDDLCMKGVGSDARVAADAALAAGCDVLLVCEPAGVRLFYEEDQSQG